MSSCRIFGSPIFCRRTIDSLILDFKHPSSVVKLLARDSSGRLRNLFRKEDALRKKLSDGSLNKCKKVSFRCERLNKEYMDIGILSFRVLYVTLRTW